MSTAASQWPRVKLGDVCEVVLGGTPSTSIDKYWGGDIPWLTPGEMGKIVGKYVNNTARQLTREGLEKGSRLFPARSVVLSTRAPIGYVFINEVPMCTNQGCKTLVPRETLFPEYLYFNLSGRTEELNQLGTGTTFKELSTKNLQSIKIPLPPLSVQREIVAKLDKELGEADALAAKFKRLAEVADAEFKAELKETFEKISREGTETRRLGDIGRVAMCKRILKSQTNTVGGIPFYKIGTFGKIANAFINPKLFTEYAEKYSYPKKGDILISAAGTIGRAVVFSGEPSYFQDSNIVWLEHDGSKITNEYLRCFYLTSPWKVSDGATIPRIYNADVEGVVIPVPSLAVQRSIVARLDAAKARCENLKKAAERGAKLAADLRKAILKETFE